MKLDIKIGFYRWWNKWFIEIKKDMKNKTEAIQTKKQIESALKLQELVKERIKLYDKTIVKPKYCREMLQSLVEESEK